MFKDLVIAMDLMESDRNATERPTISVNISALADVSGIKLKRLDTPFLDSPREVFRDFGEMDWTDGIGAIRGLDVGWAKLRWVRWETDGGSRVGGCGGWDHTAER